jgi:hypothetical protein
MVTRQKGPEAVPKAQTPEVQKEDALKASSTNPPTLEGSPVDLKLSTKTPNAMTQEARECEHPLNEAEMNLVNLKQTDCYLVNREWSDPPDLQNASSKQLWLWWCEQHEADAEYAAVRVRCKPDVAPFDAETPGSDTTLLMPAAVNTLPAQAAVPVCLTAKHDTCVAVALTLDAVEPKERGAAGGAHVSSGRPPGRRKKSPLASFLPDYELTREEMAEMRNWEKLRSQFDAPRLSMHVGTPRGTLAALAGPAAATDDEIMDAARAMDEAGICSANVMQHMPEEVTADEYFQYVMRLEDDGLEELETVGAHGDYSMAYNNVSDAFPIAIILGGAEIDDLSVDDIFNLVPNDTTPIDFARACLLMGAEARAVLAAALA